MYIQVQENAVHCCKLNEMLILAESSFFKPHQASKVYRFSNLHVYRLLLLCLILIMGFSLASLKVAVISELEKVHVYVIVAGHVQCQTVIHNLFGAVVNNTMFYQVPMVSRIHRIYHPCQYYA